MTSRYALMRLARLAGISGIAGFPASELPDPNETQAVVLDDDLLAQNKLILESYAFEKLSDHGALANTARWIARQALPTGHAFFAEKLAKHLVLLSDTQLSFFVRNSTSVESHVRIDDESGTAEDGGLFFTENLPPESLMVSVAMASDERRKKGDGGEGREKAEAILGAIWQTFGGTAVQIGGDATTGRGQVMVSFVEGAQ